MQAQQSVSRLKYRGRLENYVSFDLDERLQAFKNVRRSKADRS